MDDIIELPSADVSKLQERGQNEGNDEGNSSADEEEGVLDWTKLSWVFLLFFISCRLKSRSRLLGSDPLPLGRLSQSGETKSMSPLRARTFKNTTLKGAVVRCSVP